MILDKKINVKWNPNNMNHYVRIGYIFTNFGDMFEIKVNELPTNSHILVHVKCDVCEREKLMVYREYFSNINNGNYFACSRKCGVNKKIQTVLKRYGVRNISQHDTIKKKKEQTNIRNYGEIYMKYFPKYNLKSILHLNAISEKLNQPIMHALNGGEKKFVRYYVDGYIEEHNICIEWDEKEHTIKSKKDRDNKKDLFLKTKFGCQIVRVNENEFLNNVNVQTNLIVNKINNIIKEKHGK